MPNASAQCGAVIDRHVPKTGGTTVRTFLRHNSNLGGCRYAGYDVSSTWKSRVGFNHMKFVEIARDVAKGGRFWCVEAHVVAETFWHDLDALRNTLRLQAPRSPPCTIVTLVRVREPYSWYKSCAPAGYRTEPPAHALARCPHRNPLVGSLQPWPSWPHPWHRWPWQTTDGRYSSGSEAACRTRRGAPTSPTGCHTTCRASTCSSATRSAQAPSEASHCRADRGVATSAGRATRTNPNPNPNA